MDLVPDVDRARSTYRALRETWLAAGILDAHERLGIVITAGGLRQFAFLCHLSPSIRNDVAQVLTDLGFATEMLNVRFDLSLRMRGSHRDAESAYSSYQQKHDRFCGLGARLVNGSKSGDVPLTITSLGTRLAYPECCVQMDVETKTRDHQIVLQALIREVGQSPSEVRQGLLRKVTIYKSSNVHLKKWAKRYELTLARFPFALHAACDACLASTSSPTAQISSAHESLAREVSDELHFLVRWAARLGSGGRQ